ncbi:MAG: EamA family transporter [Nitrosomonadales bacterium]|nr:EamA family transporter [Nitrosomonadales bacterium]
MEIILVLGRLLFSTASNVYQKQLSNKGLHPLYIVATTYFVLFVLALPFLWNIGANHSQTFWVNVFLAALLDAGGWIFLVTSLSRTDLSVFGPLNAYKVVLSMLFALLFLGEVPSLQGGVGILIILAGSFLLLPAKTSGFKNSLSLFARDRGVQSRFFSIFLFSVGTIFLKNAVVASTPLDTLVWWSLMGLPLILFANMLLATGEFSRNFKDSRDYWQVIVLIGLMVFVMQFFTLVLLSTMLVAYALALFQMAMVLQVFVGKHVFQEKHFVKRLMASLVMLVGSCMVIFASANF